jgi:signal peptidase
VKKAIGLLVVALFLAFAGGAIFLALSPDYEAQVVKGESMKPTLSINDVVIIGPAEGKIKPGTIVSYKLGEEFVIHRVVSVEEGMVLTKGDANEEPDAWALPISNVQGVFLCKIPYLGFLSAFVRTPVGWGVLILLPAVLLVGYFMRDMFKRSY